MVLMLSELNISQSHPLLLSCVVYLAFKMQFIFICTLIIKKQKKYFKEYHHMQRDILRMLSLALMIKMLTKWTESTFRNMRQ